MKKFIKEFKDFINRGNVVDMAVGVVIATAFGSIVSSLVNNIIMPAISLITGNISIADWAFTFAAKAEGAEPIVIGIGAFLQTIIDFIIIAFCIFLVIKLIAKFKKKEEEKEPEPEKPAEPSNEEKLLTEIRDLLKKDAEK